MPQQQRRDITTMTGSDHGDEGRHQRRIRLDINDVPSKNPGTQTSETPFHMVAEPRQLLPSTTGRSNDIDHSSFPTSSWVSALHLQHRDPYEFPGSLWTSPSSSSGGHPPEADDIQLDRLYEPRPHRAEHHDSPGHLQQTSSTSGSQASCQATSLGAFASASGCSSHARFPRFALQQQQHLQQRFP